jgi:hypothetical protein
MRLILSEGPRLSARTGLHLPTYVREARGHLARVLEEMMKRKLIKKGDAYSVTLELMGPLLALRMMYLLMPKGPPDLKGLQAEVEKHLAFFWNAVT